MQLITRLLHRLGLNTWTERDFAEMNFGYHLSEALYWEGTPRAYEDDVPLLEAFRTGGETWTTFRKAAIDRQLIEFRERLR